MKKQEFLDALKKSLAGLSDEDVKKSLDFYGEMIDDAVENGEDEESFIAKLGTPEELAQRIISETPLSRIVKQNVKKHKWDGLTIALAIITSPIWVSLLFAFAVVGFCLFITFWAIVVSLFATAGALIAVGFVCVLAAPFFVAPYTAANIVLGIASGLVLMGVSVFIFYIAKLICKLIIKGPVFIVKKIKNLFVS